MRALMLAVVAVAIAVVLSRAARAATITVNSLSDTGATGVCVLRDAITAANSQTRINGCKAGSGSDTIKFSVTGTIALSSTLPQVTDSHLIINGPASPGITIDSTNGNNPVQAMQVAPGANLNLNNLIFRNIAFIAETQIDAGGFIYNEGRLTVTNSSFSGNGAKTPIQGTTTAGYGGAIYNGGTLTVINSGFGRNSATVGGAIYNGGTLTVTNSGFGNNASVGCGAIFDDGTTTINNSTFSGNSALGSGGHLWVGAGYQ